MTKSRGAASGNIHKKCSKKFSFREMSPKVKKKYIKELMASAMRVGYQISNISLDCN